MLDSTLLKSNFVGRDGFRWWVGQIPPESSHNTQIDKDGWGNRMKVRIMGYHPFDDGELSNDDLPWAQILLPTTVGSGAGNYAVDAKIQPADTVFGFFLDGDNAQLPVIVGVFGRTKEVSTEAYTSPFVPFTGYTTKIDNDGAKLKADQTNEKTETSQKSPYHLPPQKANGMEEISYFSGIGDVVQFTSTTSDSFINKVSVEMENVFKFIDDLKSFVGLDPAFIDEQISNALTEVTTKIQGIAGGIVNGVLNDTYTRMAPILNDGVVQLYDETYNLIFEATQSIRQAHLAGVAAQTAIIPFVQDFQNSFPGLFYDIFNSLPDIIGGMLSGLIKGAVSFATCLADQFVGGLFNKIIGAITGIIEPVLGALSAILKFAKGFDLESLLRNSTNGFIGVPLNLNFGETSQKISEEVKQWTTGGGVRCSPSKDLNKVLEIANTAAEIAKNPSSVLDQALGAVGNVVDAAGNIVNAAGEVLGAVDAVTSSALNVSQELIGVVGSMDIFNNQISNPDVTSPLTSCYGGPQLYKTPPKANVVGNSKCDDPAIIKPVYGSITGDTASIIGAVVQYGGSCYTSPPTVELRSRNGYGATINTIIKNGSVVAAYVVTDGEGYAYETQDNITITDVAILNPGTGYQDTDIVKDNLGNTYTAVINNGSITKVSPLNIVSISDLPKISIQSNTGKGAILKPVFGFITEEKTDTTVTTRDRTGKIISRKKVQKVVDCITK